MVVAVDVHQDPSTQERNLSPAHVQQPPKQSDESTSELDFDDLDSHKGDPPPRNDDDDADDNVEEDGETEDGDSRKEVNVTQFEPANSLEELELKFMKKLILLKSTIADNAS